MASRLKPLQKRSNKTPFKTTKNTHKENPQNRGNMKKGGKKLG